MEKPEKNTFFLSGSIQEILARNDTVNYSNSGVRFS